MSGRDIILGRIREALRLKGRAPGAHAQSHRPSEHPNETRRDWLPAVGASLAAQLDLFSKNSDLLKTRVIFVPSREKFPAALASLAIEEAWKKVAVQPEPWIRAAAASLPQEKVIVEKGYAKAELESCDAGITSCEVLVAQTGTLVVTSRTSGGRALSVLPPHHVVLASADQMMPDLETAFAHIKKKFGDNYPSMISLVTGPSRTGDIERILVLGAHGPKKLTVILAAGDEAGPNSSR
jgi:L-lactate dehydrogenase complex protein LldG